MKFNSLNGYKAAIYKNGVQMNSKKDFFPDEWNEEKVIDAIKGAFTDHEREKVSGNTYKGKYNGLTIYMYIANVGTSSERIISAFPQP